MPSKITLFFITPAAPQKSLLKELNSLLYYIRLKKGDNMIQIDFDIIVYRENETFIAYCPELDVSSCGNTINHAKEMLRTAVRLFLEEVEKMGTLDEILSEANYVKDTSGRWIPPKLVATELASI
ncbi:MAG TPA: hypothetical protein VJ000_01875 [Thermodesulfovibrionia bacterium]|nr:hypothetical protein [Thermodesulfovibrionia bacterium]